MYQLQVSTDFLRLHIDGEIVGEKSLSSALETDSNFNGFVKLTLVGGAGDDSSDQGYIYNLKTFPTASSIKDHRAKVCSREHGFLFSKFLLCCDPAVQNSLLNLYHEQILLMTQDPPVQLSIDKSSASEIEEVDGGVWSIVGGKVRVNVFMFSFCLNQTLLGYNQIKIEIIY